MKYYIYGYFKDINPSAPSVKQIEGRVITVGDPPQDFYYQTIIDHGKKYYSVTIPENGMHLITTERLKDAKRWIEDHMEMLVDKLSTDEAKRVAMRFRELVEEAEGK